jgi:hypothetical protein
MYADIQRAALFVSPVDFSSRRCNQNMHAVIPSAEKERAANVKEEVT